LERLECGDALERAGASLYLAGLRGWELADLLRLAGVSGSEKVSAELLAQQELVVVPAGPSSVVRVHRQIVDAACGTNCGGPDGNA